MKKKHCSTEIFNYYLNNNFIGKQVETNNSITYRCKNCRIGKFLLTKQNNYINQTKAHSRHCKTRNLTQTKVIEILNNLKNETIAVDIYKIATNNIDNNFIKKLKNDLTPFKNDSCNKNEFTPCKKNNLSPCNKDNIF